MNEEFRKELRRKYMQTFTDLFNLYLRDEKYFSNEDIKIFQEFSSRTKEGIEKVCQELVNRVMNELDNSGLLKELEESNFSLDSSEMKNLAKRIDETACNALCKYSDEVREENTSGG
jgi:hypothetical protein